MQSSSSGILWSVIVPTAGRSSALKPALRSLCRQTLASDCYEILVVNNGKDDDATDVVTHQVMNAFPQHRIRLLKVSPPGLLSGRHEGAVQAQAPILTFVDDDIAVDTDYGQSILDAFADSDVVLAGGPMLPAWESPPPAWLSEFEESIDGHSCCTWLSLGRFGDIPHTIDPDCIWGLNFSIRKDELFRLGGFHPDNVPTQFQMFQGDGETGLTRRIRREGLKALYCPRIKVWHRISASRLTETYFRNRAFYQGVCDSFAATRREGKEILDTPIPEHAAPAALEDLKKRVRNAYVDGWCFHQNAIRQSPQLLAWVLRENYWDYAYPKLEEGLDFPRAWSDRVLENPMLALGDPARVLYLARAYGQAGRFDDALRAVTSVERACPAWAVAREVSKQLERDHTQGKYH